MEVARRVRGGKWGGLGGVNRFCDGRKDQRRLGCARRTAEGGCPHMGLARGEAPLEDEFDGGLHQARTGGADYLAEGGAADVAVDRRGAEELRVVEDVEG